MVRATGRLARFENFTAEPDRTVGLGENHAAVREGRTLFPGTVVTTFQSRRFLISGANSAKIGKEIEKGEWAGLPVYTLTLEERATCPQSCAQWSGCYGNAMPWARRNDAYDPDFLPALKAEIVTLVREVCAPLANRPKLIPPKGLVIRLHVLGDFFSTTYVRMWADLLRFLPELRVYGYTARKLDDVDPDSSLIAAELDKLAQTYPDRWAIRTSHVEPGPGRTVVVDADPQSPDVIMCPAQTKSTEACSTCALCWSPAAWGKTIGFLRHGIKTSRKPAIAADGLWPAARALHERLQALGDDRGVIAGKSRAEVTRAVEVSTGSWGPALGALIKARLVRVLRAGGPRRPAVYQVFAEPQETFPPPPTLPLPAAVAKAPPPRRDPVPRRDAKPLVERKPDAPLVAHKRPYNPQVRLHPKTGAVMNPWAIGSADQYEIGTADERVAALAEEEKRRIAEQYGAAFKAKEKPDDV